MKIKLLYITVPDKSIATKIAKALLEEKLAACVNIFPFIESYYLWEGKLCENKEIPMLVKTTVALEDKLIARATELHPYKVPCIISLDITNGNPEFLKWIKNPYTTL